MELLLQAVLFLASALVVVPLSIRLGFGSVLGYLVAGMLIGPSALGFVTDVNAVLHIAELGIMLMMFIIGIEMDVRKLWNLRRSIFGHGGAQVLLCAVLLALAFIAFGVNWRVGVAAGFALSLSSTAMVIAILEQRGLMQAPIGRASFGILLFQDMAAIPMIALLPLLSPAPATTNTIAGWIVALEALGMLAAVVFGGTLLLRYLLPIIRRSGTRDMVTVFALLWVIGIALLMQSVHLSMSLGAFVAGVLLAGSDCREEIEADISHQGCIARPFLYGRGHVDQVRCPGKQAVPGCRTAPGAAGRQDIRPAFPRKADSVAAWGPRLLCGASLTGW